MADTPAQVALDEKLLPCPFCGNPATYAKGSRGWKVECEGRWGTCTINARTHYQPTKVQAQDAWNRRASLSADAGDNGQGALVERLRAMPTCSCAGDGTESPNLYEQAADRIEALTAFAAAIEQAALERAAEAAESLAVKGMSDGPKIANAIRALSGKAGEA